MAKLVPPEKDYFLFKSSFGSSVRVLGNDKPAKIVGGGGGWTIVQRPRRTSLTQWTGPDPWQVDVPILFDGWRNQDAKVERDIHVLNAMSASTAFNQPPTVLVQGPMPIQGATWIMSSIEWGDEAIWDENPKGHHLRYRQDAIVHLVQYITQEYLKINITNSLPNSYTVYGAHETLRSIANTMYGNGARWKDIQAANPQIRDPNNLKAGQKIRIP